MTWPTVKLGEVLTQPQGWITLHPDRTYKEVTVRLWGNGAVLRKEILGAEIASNSRLRVRTNQFIISRIDARNGAYGLIPPELDGAVVSNDFPVFDPNPERLDAKYLRWLSRTKPFVALCTAASEGTTNRVRLKGGRFLATEIPLPPLAEQRRLVARIDALAAKIDEAKRLRAKVNEETVSLVHSMRRNLIGDSPKDDWVPLSYYVERIENGWSPVCENRPVTDGEWGVLKVGAVSFGTFDPKENKALPYGVSPRPEYEVRSGDFIMSRANTYELVGACAPVQRTPTRLMLSDKHFRFIFRAAGTPVPQLAVEPGNGIARGIPGSRRRDVDGLRCQGESEALCPDDGRALRTGRRRCKNGDGVPTCATPCEKPLTHAHTFSEEGGIRQSPSARRRMQNRLMQSLVSKAINIAFVERQNGTDRNRNGRKVRKTYGFSKDWEVHHVLPQSNLEKRLVRVSITCTEVSHEQAASSLC